MNGALSVMIPLVQVMPILPVFNLDYLQLPVPMAMQGTWGENWNQGEKLVTLIKGHYYLNSLSFLRLLKVHNSSPGMLLLLVQSGWMTSHVLPQVLT